jgi:hypothetical protein
MKLGKIFWGLGFILLAVALILNAVGVLTPFTSFVGEISWLSVLAAILLLAFIIFLIVKGKIGGIFVPLSFIFMLFEKNIAHVCRLEDDNIINNGLVFGCACLLQLGFSILFPQRRRETKANKKARGNRHRKSSSLSSNVQYIDAESFQDEYIESSLGSCVIRFENVDKYKGGGVLNVENSLGSMEIEVPSSWRFVHNIDNSLGSVSADVDGGNPDGPILKIEGENSLGSLSIEYV